MLTDDCSIVASCFQQPDGNLWWPDLTARLIRIRKDRPASERFPSCEQYTTSRFLVGDIESTPITRWLGPGGSCRGPRLRLEGLSDAASRHPLLINRDLADADEVTQELAASAISRASALIGAVPSLAASVERLALSTHIIRQNDPSYDVSFSEPYIPFSIFVSIPGDSWKAAARIAEAIIHESMHLQLTLVEHLVPLALESAKPQYSPWKRECRAVSGLIHALYVFAVVDRWLELLPSTLPIADHIRGRREQIASEVCEINLAACKTGATDSGSTLIDALSAHFGHR